MIERIGKWSLIYGAIISIVTATFAVLLLLGLDDYFDSDTIIFYPLLMLIPVSSVVLCYLLAWLTAKQTTPLPDAQEKDKNNNIGIFFKSYFYLWGIVAVLLAAAGFLLLNYDVDNVQEVSFLTSCLAIAAWFVTVLVCVLIWAASNAWKSNKIVGFIVAFIAFIILTSCGVLIGALYYDLGANNRYYPEYNETSYYNDNTYEEVVSVVEDEEYVEEDDYTEYTENIDYDDYANAYEYFRYKYSFENPTDAVDVIRYWSWGFPTKDIEEEYRWDEEYDDDAAEYFGSRTSFKKCLRIFSSLYDNSYGNNDDIMTIANYYINDYNDGSETVVSKQLYRNSGARNVVKALLLAYDDIYSRSDKYTVLSNIQDVMSEEAPDNYWGDEMVSYCYPRIEKYMSGDTLEEMQGMACSYESEWCDQFLAAWTYSFWARRYEDGVDGAVYKALLMIDKLYK